MVEVVEQSSDKLLDTKLEVKYKDLYGQSFYLP